MRQPKFGKITCMVGLLCIATTVALHAQTFNSLASFDFSNGAYPGGAVTQGTDGNFYGANLGGGADLAGTAFVITTGGTLTVFYNFCSEQNQLLCIDGDEVQAPLIQGANGNFYGTSLFAGENNEGAVFELSSAGRFKLLYSFCSSSGCPNGQTPTAPLTLGADGNYYGTTSGGGTHSVGGDGGTIFKLTPAGALTFLYNFCAQLQGKVCLDGMWPGTLLQSTDGFLYGTTKFGGTNNKGTLFRITRSGTFTSLHNLEGDAEGLIQGTDGSIYGTTSSGGGHNAGSIFKIGAGGQPTVLYSFCSQANCSDGQFPVAGLVEGTDGNFYGTTKVGGANSNSDICGSEGCGTAFQITPSGTLTTLYNFCSQTNCTDGALPESALLLSTNGTFYGTTSYGGTSAACTPGCGSIFSLSMGFGPFVQARLNFGTAGQTVGILGNGLTGTTNVTFNGVAATFTVVSDTYITATVPTGATTGTIAVTTPSGTLNSNVAFVIP